jgi:hypothetical protein
VGPSEFALKPLFFEQCLTHVPAMGIVVACGFTGGDATIARKYYAAGKDDECDDEDTFHVFQFWVYGIITTSKPGKKLS